jgi:hypothetical protein
MGSIPDIDNIFSFFFFDHSKPHILINLVHESYNKWYRRTLCTAHNATVDQKLADPCVRRNVVLWQYSAACNEVWGLTVLARRGPTSIPAHIEERNIRQTASMHLQGILIFTTWPCCHASASPVNCRSR